MSHPPIPNGSTETSDFRGGTYVRVSPPPPTPRDSPGLPAHPTCLSRTSSSCPPHVRLMHHLMASLMYVCHFSPPLLHMCIVRLCLTIPLYNPPYILLYSLRCYQIPFRPSSSCPTHKFHTTLRQARPKAYNSGNSDDEQEFRMPVVLTGRGV